MIDLAQLQARIKLMDEKKADETVVDRCFLGQVLAELGAARAADRQAGRTFARGRTL